MRQPKMPKNTSPPLSLRRHRVPDWYEDAKLGIFVHWGLISEIKLMSSFPESFKLDGSFVEKWARVGKSVPPLFVKAIAENIRRMVLK